MDEAEKKTAEACEDEVSDLHRRLRESEVHAAGLRVQLEGSERMMGAKERAGRAQADAHDARSRLFAALDALQALTNPEGHLWHGGHAECTGECADARSVLQREGRL